MHKPASGVHANPNESHVSSKLRDVFIFGPWDNEVDGPPTAVIGRTSAWGSIAGDDTNFRRLNNVVGQVTVDQLPRPIVGTKGRPSDPLSFLSAFDPRQFQFALKIHF